MQRNPIISFGAITSKTIEDRITSYAVEIGGCYYHRSVNRLGIRQRWCVFVLFRGLDQRERDWKRLVGHSGKEIVIPASVKWKSDALGCFSEVVNGEVRHTGE